jgi:dihydrolipoamide dehydrogenase
MAADTHYDLIVIGGGSGGLTAATIGARLGAKTLLIDKENLGGDCLHYGCVPSKAMVASARMAYRMRHARDYGIHPVNVKVDIADVMKRIQRVKDDVGRHESPEIFREMGVDVKFGGAKFIDAHTLEIGGKERVTGDKIILATGSHAINPPIPGLEEAGSLNHVSIFHLEKLPKRLVVIGGGPIGCEMGQSMARFGSDVTIIDLMPRILPREEPEISQHLQKRLDEEGIKFVLSIKSSRVQKTKKAKQVIVEKDGEEITLNCDEVLVAVGRKPSIDELNLEAAGVEANKKGIIVNDTLQTNVKHIYAVGDCAGGPQFTHWAEYEARIAARNALFKGSSKRSMDLIPWVTFTDPEVARAGMTLAEAREHYQDDRIHEHSVPFEKVDRAVCEGEPEGLIKVVVDKKDRILGVHIIGMEAGEALAEWVLAMAHYISLPKIGNAIHVYPTLGRVNRRVVDARFMAHGVSKWTTKFFANFTPRDV